MKAVLDHIDHPAAHIQTFWFRPEKPVRYAAGQFTELALPHPNVDDRGDRRWFTFASSPTEALLSITTKFPASNISTFKQTLLSLWPGDSVTLAEPMGDFVLPKTATIPIIFIASGIGITPARSIIKYLFDTQEQRNITLLYAVHRPEDLAFTDIFEAYDMQYVPIAKEPAAGWHGEAGVLSAERIIKYAQDKSNCLFYLSGPELMVESLAGSLAQRGIDKRNIATDFFPGYE